MNASTVALLAALGYPVSAALGLLGKGLFDRRGVRAQTDASEAAARASDAQAMAANYAAMKGLADARGEELDRMVEAAKGYADEMRQLRADLIASDRSHRADLAASDQACNERLASVERRHGEEMLALENRYKGRIEHLEHTVSEMTEFNRKLQRLIEVSPKGTS